MHVCVCVDGGFLILNPTDVVVSVNDYAIGACVLFGITIKKHYCDYYYYHHINIAV